MNFADAMTEESKWTKTWNGADALGTTSNANLDLFGRAGSMRGADVVDKYTLIDEAYKENADFAMKLLFFVRDVRGGYGERDTFNQMFARLADTRPESVKKNLWGVLEFGRAKDLYSLVGTKCEDDMWQFMKSQFELDYENMRAEKSISLLAKWIATPDASSDKTKQLGKLTAKKLGYSYRTMRDYKKKLREMRKYLDLPEAKMCAGKWDEIEYSKCASKFMLTHRQAFMRHDEARYSQFINRVNDGETTMNMGVTYPSDIMQKVINNYTPDLEAMWKSLPDLNEGNALVMCDTSGSMTWNGSGAVKPITVATALSIYLAERNKGCFKDKFMTFESSPHFVEIVGSTLDVKYHNIMKASWGGSTDLEGAFNKILDLARTYKMSQEDLPETLIVVSDMQINHCRGVADGEKLTFHEAMSRKFEKAGYRMPSVVFWNVNAANATFHASKSDAGVSLVSGYSPNILKQVFASIGKSPLDTMMEVINSERYVNIVA